MCVYVCVSVFLVKLRENNINLGLAKPLDSCQPRKNTPGLLN